MSVKNLSWGGYSGQLDVGLSSDGKVAQVILWRRLTPLDEWRWRLAGHAPALLAHLPPLRTWEKRRAS